MGKNLSTNPPEETNVKRALKRASKAIKMGDISLAETIYRQILSRYPNNLTAKRELNEISKTMPTADTAEGLAQASASLLEQLRDGDLQDGLVKAKHLIKRFSQSTQLLNIKGIFELKLEKHDAAETSFKQALTMNSQNEAALNNLAALAIKKADFASAERYARQATDIDNCEVSAHLNRGRALIGLEQFENALPCLFKAFEMKPEIPTINFLIGLALFATNEAAKARQYFDNQLSIQPNDLEALRYQAMVLAKLEQPEEVIGLYRRIIELEPDNPEGHYNLGVVLQQKFEYLESIKCYQTAFQLNPTHVDAIYSCGRALHALNRVSDAIVLYRKALSIEPQHSKSSNNLAAGLITQGEVVAAYQILFEILVDNCGDDDVLKNFGLVLKLISHKPDIRTIPILESFLENPNAGRPSSVCPQAIGLLKQDPEIRSLIGPRWFDYTTSKLETIIWSLSEKKLLLQLLELSLIPDIELESLLINIRRALLTNLRCLVEDATDLPLDLHVALALQAFTNEYVYLETKEELTSVADLKFEIENLLTAGVQPHPMQVACLAMYRPLYQYTWARQLTEINALSKLFIRQIYEPEIEQKLMTTITNLTEVTNSTSSLIKKHYEENPYPRWVRCSRSRASVSLFEYCQQGGIRVRDIAAVSSIKNPRVLIAGCGTGQHVIESVSQWKDCSVLAIDLSRTSIAYAKRKTDELQIKNIAYHQADILELGSLRDRFDVIESVGVLHHLADPLGGWRVLVSLLKPGGLMKIGLYSEAARSSVALIKDEILQKKIEDTESSMKEFRQFILESDEAHHVAVKSWTDFYSLSEFRDLLFHRMEHRFTIPKIQDSLNELGLIFCGFSSDIPKIKFRSSNHSADSIYDLAKWHEYEVQNPKLFSAMYQFWCQKN